MTKLWRWIGFGIDLAALALEELRRRRKPPVKDPEKRKDALDDAADERKDELRGR